MILFHCNSTLSICNCCHKVSNIPSCAFVTAFSSEARTKSLPRVFPVYRSWSLWLCKKIPFMSKPCPFQTEFYTLLPKVCRTFTKNFSSKLKPEYQIIFCQDSFPLNATPFQASSLQNCTNCLLANLWCNGGFYHNFIFAQKHKSFPFFLVSAFFAIRYLSFVEQLVLMVSSLIILS